MKRVSIRRTFTTSAYAFGTVDFTGDMPIILGPDGPSLGGFVCPATIVRAELWKVGQLRPGNRVRFVPVARAAAELAASEQDRAIAMRKGAPSASLSAVPVADAVLRRLPAQGSRRVSSTGHRATNFCSSNTEKPCSIWSCASESTR